jgi:hypothetical protein
MVSRPSSKETNAQVTRERFKDSAPLPTLRYVTREIDLGYQDVYGDAVTSLVLLRADALVAPAGSNQKKAVVALNKWATANPGVIFISDPDMRKLLKAQGLDDKRRPQAIEYLVKASVITRASGGYTVRKPAQSKHVAQFDAATSRAA